MVANEFRRTASVAVQADGAFPVAGIYCQSGVECSGVTIVAAGHALKCAFQIR